MAVSTFWPTVSEARFRPNVTCARHHARSLPSDLAMPTQQDPAAAADAAERALHAAVATFGGQPRESQITLTRAVADAFTSGTHLIAQAPTGVGKSLGYLIPAALHARTVPGPVVVSTRTKALQQQLIDKDTPAVAATIDGLKVAVLKGRSEYLCRSKLHDVTMSEPLFERPVDPDGWNALVDWALQTDDGDRANAPDGTTPPMWTAVSVRPRECPSASKCRFGTTCFAEQARDVASDADVLIVNHTLLLLNAAADGWILPAHQACVVDEAHELVAAASDVFGVAVSGHRIRQVANQARTLLGDDAPSPARLLDTTERFVATLDAVDTDRPVTSDSPVHRQVTAVTSRVKTVLATLRTGMSDVSEDGQVRWLQVITMAAGLADDLAALANIDDAGQVVHVERSGNGTSTLRATPIDVAGLLADTLLTERTVVFTSATLTVGGSLDIPASQLGAETGTYRTLQVPSPFDHASRALLYVPRDGPDPRQPNYDQVTLDTTLQIIRAAGGRTLCLFTSWRRLKLTAEWLTGRLPTGVELLVQGDAPPQRLMERYVADPHTVLLGVASFWAGISAEGTSSVAVIIDKLPFPRPNDPVLDARRDLASQAGQSPFHTVDLPITATTLAQGAGRLIRCFDLETEVLTTDGWKRYDEVRPGMHTYGIAPEDMQGGNRIRNGRPFLSTNPVTAVQYNPDPEPMLSIKGRGIDARVTPDHGMIIQTKSVSTGHATTRRNGHEWTYSTQRTRSSPPFRKVPADELPERFRIPLAGHVRRKPTKLQREWFHLLGLMISDGHISKSKPLVSLHQSTAKPKVIKFIEGTLEALDLKYKRYVSDRAGTVMEKNGDRCGTRTGDMVAWHVHGHDAAAVRDVIHRGWRRRHSHKKAFRKRTHQAWRNGEKVTVDGWKDIAERDRIPRWALERASRPQLLALLKGMMAGDGTWNDPSRDDYTSGTYYTANPKLVDDLQELLALVGYRSATRERPDRSGRYEVSFSDRASTELLKPSAVSAAGASPSWCLTTELGNVLMRRGGSTFIAGNTVDDFGLIAVLDPRLATKSYRQTLIGSLPPARRTVNLDADGWDDRLATVTPDTVGQLLEELGRTPGGPPVVPWLQARLLAAGETLTTAGLAAAGS